MLPSLSCEVLSSPSPRLLSSRPPHLRTPCLCARAVWMTIFLLCCCCWGLLLHLCPLIQSLTSHQHTQCQQVQACSAGEFEKTKPTLAADRVCATKGKCNDKQYISNQGENIDTECTGLTVCQVRACAHACVPGVWVRGGVGRGQATVCPTPKIWSGQCLRYSVLDSTHSLFGFSQALWVTGPSILQLSGGFDKVRC